MNKKCCLMVFLTAALLLMCGCTAQEAKPDTGAATGADERTPVSKAPVQDINSLPLEDDTALYQEYDPLEPVCFYITVVGGSAADGTNHTFSEVNSYTNLQGTVGAQKIKSEIIFQVGDETGPLQDEVGYGAVASNATINVRGRTSTGYPQKSYRIDLFDSAGLWRGQRAIAINKHPNDPTRLRNMLFFELLRDVPGMTSLRTQFVHVYIKDRTDPDAADAFVDYGLFTQVELPNGRYLRNHGLSRNGALYKANMCEMLRYEDKLRLETDPAFNADAFRSILEPKTTHDHTKLLQMLDAVNDVTIPIQDVIGKHFDLDNLTSYLAYNMLMANPDSNAQNYLLYSPVNSETWYYICWDGDGALTYYEDELLGNAWSEASWTRGVSCYWGVKLFNRMLRVPEYREAVLDKVELLRTEVVNAARIKELVAKYRQTTDRFTAVMPDVVNLQVEREQLELIYQNMPYDTDRAYEDILSSFQRPMPYFLSDVSARGNGLELGWDAAYDFGAEFVRYHVQVATDWTFAAETVVYESGDHLQTSLEIPMLPPGVYYWRAIAANESGRTQIAFDQVVTDSGAHEGMRRFVIHEDGTVSNPI